MESLEEIAIRRTKSLLTSGILRRPIRPKLPHNLALQIHDLKINHNYVLTGDPNWHNLFPKLIFGPRPKPFKHGWLLDKLPSALHGYEVNSLFRDKISYLVPEDFSVNDPLIKFRTRWKRWTHHSQRATTVVRDDQSITVVELYCYTDLEKTALFINLEVAQENLRRLDALIPYSVRRHSSHIDDYWRSKQR